MQFFKKKWFEFLTLAIAIVALIFSWQTITISSRQSAPKIILIDTAVKGGIIEDNFATGLSKEDTYRCVNQQISPSEKYFFQQAKIRLANVGGASVSIVNFDVVLLYLGEEFKLMGDGNASLINWKELGILPITNISFHILKTPSIGCDLSFSRIPAENYLTLPARIQEYSAQDIYIVALFDVKGQKYSLDPWIGYNPIQINYVIEFSTGEKLSIPTETVLNFLHR